MDFEILIRLLAPCLPGLMGMGQKAGEASVTAAAKKVGEQSAQQAGKIWHSLWPKVKNKEAARKAAEDVAKDPADEDARVDLRRQLKKILESDEELAAAVTELLETAKTDPQGTWIQVKGDGNQVIGSMQGNAKAIGSVTGDVRM